MFPNTNDPTYGIFVKEQIDAIRTHEDIDYDVYVINGKRGYQEYLKSIFRIRSFVRNGGYDLIHIHYGLSGLFLLFGKPAVPVIMTLHGGDIQAEQGRMVQVELTKCILRRCDYVITLNERMDELVRRYVEKSEIIPCSVNMRFFVPISKEKERTGKIKVLFPSARSRKVKDYPLFKRTCEVLRDEYGLDVEEFYLEDLSRKEVAKLFKEVDLLLMTSISEGSPQVVKEAMACNLPVVSTNVGDVALLLEGVRDCYVAESRDEKLLAALAYKSLAKKHKIGMSPIEKLKELGLDDDHVAWRLLKVYHDLIKSIQKCKLSGVK